MLRGSSWAAERSLSAGTRVYVPPNQSVQSGERAALKGHDQRPGSFFSGRISSRATYVHTLPIEGIVLVRLFVIILFFVAVRVFYLGCGTFLSLSLSLSMSFFFHFYQALMQFWEVNKRNPSLCTFIICTHRHTHTYIIYMYTYKYWNDEENFPTHRFYLSTVFTSPLPAPLLVSFFFYYLPWFHLFPLSNIK